MEYTAEIVDVVVIGAGHAGIEAALASARLGARTVLFSISMDAVANLPCNPAIGGTAKGHLVREIDALGGEMGKAADAVLIQSRMLNRGKGPAVHSLRAQVDRAQYHAYMKNIVENQPNLILKQAEITDINLDGKGAVASVVTALGAVYLCKAAIICTGTFLNGRIFVGEHAFDSGPDGLIAPTRLTACLRRMGLPLRRFKTGTPARVHRDSINFEKLEAQDGDDPITPFSFETTNTLENKVQCHIAYTNEKTHTVIRRNLHRSPLYGGEIVGVGPRYCPSVEDKVVRFADKPRHQIFVEPMGLDTKEMYLQGLSSSLPEEVQIELYRTIVGFEKIQIIRNAYAIEYDCVDPLALYPTLAFKSVPGLYGAGQFNGTSGYEEAAAQGLVAAINAVHMINGKKELVLARSSSYIGTLIDDLVTKGCQDPYRMMTSRSEYRLLLRQDNADARLTAIGHDIGLISEQRWKMFHVKQSCINSELKRIKSVTLPPSPALNAYLDEAGTTGVATGIRFEDLLKRPQVSYRELCAYDPDSQDIPADIAEAVEIEVKYAGYIKRQFAQAQETAKLDNVQLPMDIDYSVIPEIRLEAREKLQKVKPGSIGQASRISGVSPADISVLLIYLEKRRRLRSD
ncbi:MAG: tRNA uridine-5-carboxymethylaminomethyl(34) synthesis enzyme MnmG [Oscillospiraceae bacterium]|nr:tRNA uridine-5-carboxymethylaminomethyl(34) synthesis enzyme MnmG [Oscillospiraceae bacterium]